MRSAERAPSLTASDSPSEVVCDGVGAGGDRCPLCSPTRSPALESPPGTWPLCGFPFLLSIPHSSVITLRSKVGNICCPHFRKVQGAGLRREQARPAASRDSGAGACALLLRRRVAGGGVTMGGERPLKTILEICTGKM